MMTHTGLSDNVIKGGEHQVLYFPRYMPEAEKGVAAVFTAYYRVMQTSLISSKQN